MSIDEYFGRLGVIHTEPDCNICDNPAVTLGNSKVASKIIWGLVALLSVIAAYTLVFHFDDVVGGMPPPHNYSVNLASDTSDPCSNPHAFVFGYDSNGAPLCRFVTGCPYGDSVPLGPECDRLKQFNDTSMETQIPAMTTPDIPTFAGK